MAASSFQLADVLLLMCFLLLVFDVLLRQVLVCWGFQWRGLLVFIAPASFSFSACRSCNCSQDVTYHKYANGEAHLELIAKLYTLLLQFHLKAQSSWMQKESLQLCNRAPNSFKRFWSCSENHNLHSNKDYLSPSNLMVELIWSSLQSYRLSFLQSFLCFLEDPVVVGAAQRESIALQRAPKASRD